MSNSTRMLISALVIFFIPLASVYGQQAQTSPPTNDQQKRIDELTGVVTDLVGQMKYLRALDSKQRDAVLAAQNQAEQSYYVSYVSLNQNGDRLREHQQKVFAWQIMAANWLLLVVMVVSLSGVAFAGYEMVSARRLISRGIGRPPASAPEQVSAGGEVVVPVKSQEQDRDNNMRQQAADSHVISPERIDITIEPTKIHITSAVIGIIILSISLAFLYLFLKEVYAIKVLEITDTGGIKLVTPQTANSP